jgi:hypothetical protein
VSVPPQSLRAPASVRPKPATGTLLAGRYECIRELGGGGMAVVYEVLDRVSGRRLAFKRLHIGMLQERQKRARALFEREFHTLAQLAHPRIVEVYDFGIDDAGPYYTMELLDGGDLQQLAPVDPARLCAIARDVCSALALVHSRRVLHRDVSPRNIRCRPDGTAKLIDFGAMAMMGPTKELVGTPAFAAPELVHLQPLDARADVYALGATLYHALTGRHAYPARDFESLPGLWQFSVVRPSELVAGVPEALDALLLDMLQLDPKNRPTNAAEVLERLAAVEGRPVVEHAQAAQAYLSIPAFVGRDSELRRIRSYAQRALRGAGSAVLVRGAAGVGRSRFLAAAVLAGKLLGVEVLRADADESIVGDYAAVRSLLLQLQHAQPALTLAAAAADLPVLCHIAPELAGEQAVELKTFADSSALRPVLQQAVRQLLLRVAAKHPLMLALDDFDRFDEASTSAIALLSRELRRAPLVIIATMSLERERPASSGYRMYEDSSSHLLLEPFAAEQTRSLLGSVFGETSNLDLLTHRLLTVSQGVPRDIMRLAQHLVDRGVILYRSGSWSLPSHFDAGELPESVAQVLRTRVVALDDTERAIASALALCAEQSFAFEECLVLAAQRDPARVMHALAGLVAAELVRATGEHYALADRVVVPVLLAELDRAQTMSAHLRLAKVFEQRTSEQFRVAQHLMRGGDQARAVSLFVSHAIQSQELTDRDAEAFQQYIRSLPSDWLQTFEDAIALCQALDRPRSELYGLRSRLAGLVAVIGLRATEHVDRLLNELYHASGLADWDALDPQLPHMERLKQALEATQARFDALPAHERTLDPFTAIRALARSTITANGMYAPLLDAAAMRGLPALEPLAPLSPAIEVVAGLSRGVYARLTGRTDRAYEEYSKLIARTEAPDRAGLEVSHHRYMRVIVMNALGMLEASMGLASCLRWAEQIEADPLFQLNGLLVRVLYRMWQGECLQAERDQRRIETLRIESSARQNFENTHLLWQVGAHAAMEDLTRLRRTMEEIRRTAEDFPRWQPVLAYAKAEFQRVRGDLRHAESELSTALTKINAGEHQIWPNMAAARVRVLDDLGRRAEAVAAGQAYMQQALDAEIGFARHYITLALAVAEAKHGIATAAERAEQVIATLKQLGSTGLNLALAYEARARVAIALNDRAGYELYSGLFETECVPSAGEALGPKLHKLKREAQRQNMAAAVAAVPHVAGGMGYTQLKAKLQACSGTVERAHIMLSVLAVQCGVSEGFLYRMTEDGPVWTATVGLRATPPEALDAIVRDYIAGELAGSDAVTGDATELDIRTEWTSFGKVNYRPVLLSHYDEAGRHVITGLCVFVVASSQRFVHPTDFIAQLSRLCVELGDAEPSVVADE